LVDATLFQKENPLITRDSSKDNEKVDSPTCSIAAGEGKSPKGFFLLHGRQLC